MTIRTKRAYDPAAPDDGTRILVDRYWPRGILEADILIEGWFKDLAPSPELIAWFGHKQDRWPEFKGRYWEELDRSNHGESISRLCDFAKSGTLTLVFGARDRDRNNAQALGEYLLARVPDAGIERVSPASRTDRTQPRRLSKISWIVQPDWLWILFALSIPILILVIGALALAFGLLAWIVVFGGFAVLSSGTILRASSQERRQRAIVGGPAPQEAASLWAGVGELGLAVGSFVAGMAILFLVLSAFMRHAGYLH